MDIDVRTQGVRMHRASRLELLRRVREAFRHLSRAVARILVRVMPAAGGGRAAAHECVVEVHLQDGRVERVHERQRHVTELLRRALRHATDRLTALARPGPKLVPLRIRRQLPREDIR